MSSFSTVPSADWVASNALAFAFPDRFPVSTGHTLVVTRREIATWWDATPAEQAAVFDLVALVKQQLDIERSPDGYNVGFNSGDAAGQTVPHFHVHVIPRYFGDVPDPRGGVRHVIPRLANYLDPTPNFDGEESSLITPFEGRLFVELTRCLLNDRFDRIDLLVSFVMRSGVDLIDARIDEALARGTHVRLLTTDYLQVTDVGALGFFLDRIGHSGSGGQLEAKCSATPRQAFTRRRTSSGHRRSSQASPSSEAATSAGPVSSMVWSGTSRPATSATFVRPSIACGAIDVPSV